MQTKVVAGAAKWWSWNDELICGSGERKRQERGADGGIVVPFGLDGRNDQIVRVVAPGQENANQGLVVANPGLRHGGVHETQVANGGGDGGGADGGAGGLADELPAGPGHGGVGGRRFQVLW